MFQQAIQTSEQQTYVRKLLGFHFRIEYKTGSSNKVADALSRVHADQFFDSINSQAELFSIISKLIVDILTTLHEDNLSLPDLLLLHKKFAAGKLSSAFSVREGLLLYNHRYYVSPHSKLKSMLLKEFHDSPMAGHASVKRTLV